MKNKYDIEYEKDGELPFIEHPALWESLKDQKYQLLGLIMFCGYISFVFIHLSN